LCPEHRAQRGVDVAGFGDHLDRILGSQQQPEAGADHAVVVREDDPDR
jgi:hypothetical protein